MHALSLRAGVCLAEWLGNSLLADTLRVFTARTTSIALLYQSSPDAAQSCEDRVRLVAALERGDAEGMTMLMVTDEMSFARKVSDRVVFIHQRRVHELEAPAGVFGNAKTPELRQFLVTA